MDRTTLVNAIKNGPVRVTMNDGSQYEIPNVEFCVVSDIAAFVLVRNADGKLGAKILALVCMLSIEPLPVLQDK